MLCVQNVCVLTKGMESYSSEQKRILNLVLFLSLRFVHVDAVHSKTSLYLYKEKTKYLKQSTMWISSVSNVMKIGVEN